MEPYISPKYVNDLDHILRDEALRGNFAIGIVLKHLIELGFTNARYFAVAEDYITHKDYFVLSAMESKVRHAPIPHPVLFRVEELGLTIHHLHREPIMFKHDDARLNPNIRKIYADLGIDHLPNLFVPVYSNQELVGKLCLSWDGKSTDLSGDDLQSLQTIAGLCARYRRIASDTRIRTLAQAMDKLEPTRESTKTKYQIMDAVSGLIMDALKPTMLAVFEYRWLTDELTKQHEASSAGTPVVEFPESYARGEFLTGHAYPNPSCRLVVDVSSAYATGSNLIEPRSFQRHRQSLGTPLSVLFSSLQCKETHLLLRAFNRSDNNSLPFDNFHVDLLAGSTRRIKYWLEEVQSAKSTRSLGTFAAVALKQFTEPGDLIRSLIKELKEELPEDLILLASEREHAGIDTYYPPWLGDSNVVGGELRSLLNVMPPNEFKIVTRQIVNQTYGRPIVAEKHSCALLWRFESGDLEGVMIFPFISSRQCFENLKHMPPGLREKFSICFAVLIGSLNASISHISMESAKRLIGQIGHEIEAPINELASLAQEELLKVDAEIGKSELALPSIKQMISERAGRAVTQLDKQLNHISILMDVAVDMAQEINNRIEVTYEAFDLKKLVEGVGEKCRRQINFFQKPGQRCEFKFNEAMNRFQSFVGDRYLIEKVFVNIFRNALKYSIPPGSGEPIVIEVIGNPQTEWCIIQVRNWGTPIRSDSFERIFRPFERGDTFDKIRARRGMGLGLYVARKFANAHAGTVSCLSSEPTLNDPARRYLEGYSTVFEVRLSRRLRAGTNVVGP